MELCVEDSEPSELGGVPGEDVLAAAVGSFVHAATSFSTYVGNRELKVSWKSGGIYSAPSSAVRSPSSSTSRSAADL